MIAEAVRSEQVELIPIKDIHPSPNNRRIGGFDRKKLQQLADSIKAVGIQQPAVVRHRTNNEYELVIGERRWRACKLAGIDRLPCFIREIDDINVMKIQTIENLQREDVHPLDEADGFRNLMERGNMTVDQIAEEIGQTRSYIYHRLKLCVLGSKPRDALIKEKISTAHAELIARMPGHYQDKALDLCFDNIWSINRSTKIILPIKIVHKKIAQELFHDLHAAAFKKDDADLLPDAGPCTICPKRTGTVPELFPELEGKDCCTDPRCYDAKRSAFVKKMQKELKSQDGEVVEVMGEYGWNDPDGKNAVSRYEWEECKAKEPDAKQVLIVSGADKGRVTYGKIKANEDKDRYFKFEIENAKSGNDRKCQQAVWDKIFELIRSWYETNKGTWDPDKKEWIIIAKRFFEYLRYQYESPKDIFKIYGWGKTDNSHNDIDSRLSIMDVKDLFVFLMNCSLVSSINRYTGDDDIESLQTVAGLHDIDTKTIEDEIKKEYAEKWKKIKAKMQKEHEKKNVN